MPRPPVLVPSIVALVDEETLIFGLGDSLSDFDEVQVPEECYLHEFAELDTSSPDHVLRFCQMYGEVGWHDRRDLPNDVQFAAGDWHDRSYPDGCPHVAAPRPDLTLSDYWWPLQDYIERGIVPSDWGPSGDVHPWRRRGVPCDHPIRFQAVAEVGLYQAVMRDMVRTRDYLQGDTPDKEFLDSLEWPSEQLADSRETRRGAITQLVDTINRGLMVFHVRVEPVPFLESPPASPTPNVYEVMCLQLANHIAEGAEYHRCQAEGCGRLFVRTEGYARYGQNKLHGNKYCSQRCANRQAQRQYRRRKAAAKATDNGPSRESSHS